MAFTCFRYSRRIVRLNKLLMFSWAIEVVMKFSIALLEYLDLQFDLDLDALAQLVGCDPVHFRIAVMADLASCRSRCVHRSVLAVRWTNNCQQPLGSGSDSGALLTFWVDGRRCWCC